MDFLHGVYWANKIAKNMKQRLPDNTAKAACIRKLILAEESLLCTRYPLLRYKNFWAMSVFILSTSAIFACAIAYYSGVISAVFCVPVIAVFLSFLHELEHDLIHKLYFRNRKTLRFLMMSTVWVLRGNIISPWYRQKIHLRHHAVSGQCADIEERLIGNGMKFGIPRILAMSDGMLSVLTRPRELGSIDGYSFRKIFLASFPVTLGFYGLLMLVIMGFSARTLGIKGWDSQYLQLIFIVYLLPNLIRQASLNILSSTMHYFGDVEESMQEVQILDNWCFLPLQLFCCFFGKSHAVHHFVVPQPFYLRIWIAFRINEVLALNGVRRGDWRSLFRQNSFQQ